MKKLDKTGPRALIAGASGLVGRALLTRILHEATYAHVISLGRRVLPSDFDARSATRPQDPGPRLEQRIVDFKDLPPLPAIDDVFIALGTTIKVAGSQQGFRAVDFDAVLATARAGRAAGATRLGVVSAMGANARSSVFYNRVKGEMEEAVAALGYTCVVIARPSLIEGDRAALQQPGRSGEAWGLRLAHMVNPLLPRNLKSIPADAIAAGILARIKAGAPGVQVVPSGDLQR